MGTLSYAAVYLSYGFYHLAQAKSLAKRRTAVNLAGRPSRSLPYATFNTRFSQVSHQPVWYFSKPWIIIGKPLLVSICLRNALRSKCSSPNCHYYYFIIAFFSPDRWTRSFIYFGIGVIFIVYTVTSSITVGLCIPRKGERWALALPSSRCRDTMVTSYVQGIFNIVSDLYVLVLPLPVVWKLQLPLREKVGVSAVFMTGFLSVPLNLIPGFTLPLTGAIGHAEQVRWAFIIAPCSQRTPTGLDMKSVSVVPCEYHADDWLFLSLMALSILEMTLGIICGCMPYLAPMLKRWYLRWSQLSLLKNLMSRISSSRKRPGRSPGSSGFSGIESRPPNNHYLETNILRSVKGERKFLGSQFCAEKVAC